MKFDLKYLANKYSIKVLNLDKKHPKCRINSSKI